MKNFWIIQKYVLPLLNNKNTMKHFLFILSLTILGLTPIIAKASHSHSSHSHSSHSHSSHSSHSSHGSHSSGSHSFGTHSHSTPHTSHHSTPRYTKSTITHSDIHVSPIPNHNGYIYYYVLLNHHTNSNDTIWGANQDDVIKHTATAFTDDEANSYDYGNVIIVIFGIVGIALIATMALKS